MNKINSIYNNPTVSVLIATYNRAEMLRRAVQSVLDQTFEDLELLIVSDASTDNTVEVVRSFGDPRIIYLEQETNQGYPSARNRGLEVSRGKYIAFLDDDDEWLPGKLQLQVELLEKAPPEIGLVYGWVEYFQDGVISNIHSPSIRGDVFAKMLDKQAIGFPTTIIIRREVVEKVGDLDTEYSRGSDGNYWKKISKYFQIDFVPEIVARVYAGHADRITENTSENLRNEALALESRLRMFESDWTKYQVQKANVIAQLGTSYLKQGKTTDGLCALGRLLRCKIGLWLKIMLVYMTARRSAGHYWQKFAKKIRARYE